MYKAGGPTSASQILATILAEVRLAEIWLSEVRHTHHCKFLSQLIHYIFKQKGGLGIAEISCKIIAEIRPAEVGSRSYKGMKHI